VADKTTKEQEAEGVVHVPETEGGVPTDPQTVEEFRKEQAAEWGVYTANGPIYIGGVRAFNKGDAVPKAHVDSGAVSPEQVQKG
jgi:hypothetical protein